MSLFGTGRREGICAVLLLILVALLQQAPGIVFGSPRAPIDPTAIATGRTTAIDLSSEPATNQTILLPAMQQAGQALARGSLPTWNPYARFGEPFAVSGAPIAYPPFWPLMLPDGDRWLDLVMLLHSALACVLAYRMLRALTASRYSAFLGGGLFGLGWFMTVAQDRLPEAAAAVWLPWIVTASRRLAFAKDRLPHAVAFAVATTVPFLTGGTGTAIAGAVLALGCALAGVLAIDRDDRPAAAVASLVGAGLAMLLTAPLWLHALENGPALAAAPPAPPPRLQTAGLAGLLLPGLFGELGRAAPQALAQANPGAEGVELALYPGALTLFVAWLGLLRPKRTRLALFWLLIAGGSLLLALDGPLADTALQVLPGCYERPGAWLAVFHLATVVLVALGIENFFDAPRARRLAVPVIGITAAVTGSVVLLLAWLWPASAGPFVDLLAGPVDDADRDRSIAHLASCAIVPAATSTLIAVLFLTWHRLGILRFKPALATVALAELCVLALLHVPRAERAVDPRYAGMLPAQGERVVRVGEPDLPPAGWYAGRDGIRAVDTTGRGVLERTARYLEAIEPGLVSHGLRTRIGPLDRSARLDGELVDRAGIAAVLASRTPASSRFVPVGGTPGGAAVGRRVQPFIHLEPRPRVRFAYAVTAAADAGTAAGGLRSLDGEEVLIEGARPEFEPARPGREPELEIVDDRPDRFHARVDLHDGRGYLVIADAIAPGWRATVDGQPVAILPADVAFRAIPLHEGRHEVVCEYRPRSLVLGMALGAFGLVLAAAALVSRLWRR